MENENNFNSTIEDELISKLEDLESECDNLTDFITCVRMSAIHYNRVSEYLIKLSEFTSSYIEYQHVMPNILQDLYKQLENLINKRNSLQKDQKLLKSELNKIEEKPTKE